MDSGETKVEQFASNEEALAEIAKRSGIKLARRGSKARAEQESGFRAGKKFLEVEAKVPDPEIPAKLRDVMVAICNQPRAHRIVAVERVTEGNAAGRAGRTYCCHPDCVEVGANATKYSSVIALCVDADRKLLYRDQQLLPLKDGEGNEIVVWPLDKAIEANRADALEARARTLRVLKAARSLRRTREWKAFRAAYEKAHAAEVDLEACRDFADSAASRHLVHYAEVRHDGALRTLKAAVPAAARALAAIEKREPELCAVASGSSTKMQVLGSLLPEFVGETLADLNYLMAIINDVNKYQPRKARSRGAKERGVAVDDGGIITVDLDADSRAARP